MVDYIADLMNQTFFGIPTIFIIAIFIAVVLIVWKYKPKQKEFKEKDPKDETHKKYKELMEMHGGGNIKQRLHWGEEFKGLLGKGVPKSENETLYEYYPKPLVSARIKKVFHRNKFIVIPNEALTKYDKEYKVNPSYIADNILGIIVYSKNTKDKVLDEPYKINQEETMKAMINWLPLQTWLSIQHAQSSEGLDHLAEIEKEKKKAMVSEMTGKKVK